MAVRKIETPPCKQCGQPLVTKVMRIIDEQCWKCEGPIKVAILHSPNGYIRGDTHPGPDQFTPEEVAFAKSKQVILNSQRSLTANDTYLANSCGACDAFVGGYYLFDHFSKAEDKQVPSQDFELGYHCEDCYMETQSRGVDGQ